MIIEFSYPKFTKIFKSFTKEKFIKNKCNWYGYLWLLIIYSFILLLLYFLARRGDAKTVKKILEQEATMTTLDERDCVRRNINFFDQIMIKFNF